MWLSGWSARDDPAEGVEQELFAKAVVFEDAGGRRVAIANLEVLFVPPELRHAVAKRCEASYGLPPDALVVHSTHTHCGPVVRDVRVDVYGLDEHRREQAAAYRAHLEDVLVRLVGQALDDAEPARLSYSHARCGFAMNRRLPTADGLAHEPNPDGPVDHDVPVLVAETGAEEPTAILFGYACHPTTMRHHLKFGGDWPGFAQAFVEEAHPGATALCLTGCAGDQNPYPRGTVELARLYGRALATAVDGALSARRRPIHGPLRTVYEEQPVAFQDPPPREELERMAASDDPPDRTRGRALLAELDENGTIRTEYPYPIQAIGFGDDLTTIALAGEVLVEYALELKEALPGRVWVAGFCNADFTYVPTAEAITEGGYEGGGVIRNTTYPGPLQPDVEERVLRAARVAGNRVSGPVDDA